MQFVTKFVCAALLLSVASVAVAEDVKLAKSPSETMVGDWSLDVDATVKKMEAAAKSEEEKAALGFAKTMMASMKMSFKIAADGKMSLSMKAGDKNETKEGSYSVKSETDNSLVMDGTFDEKTKSATLNFPSNNQMEMSVDSQTMVFKRDKAE